MESEKKETTIVKRDVTLTMTLEEAKLLYDIMGLNVSIPAAFNTNFHGDSRNVMGFLSTVRTTLTKSIY